MTPRRSAARPFGRPVGRVSMAAGHAPAGSLAGFPPRYRDGGGAAPGARPRNFCQRNQRVGLLRPSRLAAIARHIGPWRPSPLGLDADNDRSCRATAGWTGTKAQRCRDSGSRPNEAGSEHLAPGKRPEVPSGPAAPAGRIEGGAGLWPIWVRGVALPRSPVGADCQPEARRAAGHRRRRLTPGFWRRQAHGKPTPRRGSDSRF